MKLRRRVRLLLRDDRRTALRRQACEGIDGPIRSPRLLYGSPIDFTPSHKLMLMGNYRPEVSDMSDGMGVA